MQIKKDDVNYFVVLLKTHVRNGELKNKIIPRLEDCSQGMIRVIMLLTVGASLEYIKNQTGAGDSLIIKLMEDYGCLHGKFPDIYLMIPALQTDSNLLRDIMNMAIVNNNLAFLKKIEHLTKIMDVMNKSSFLRASEEKKTTVAENTFIPKEDNKELTVIKPATVAPKMKISKEALKFYKSLSFDIKKSLNEVHNSKGPEKFHTKGKGLEAYLKEKEGEPDDHS